MSKLAISKKDDGFETSFKLDDIIYFNGFGKTKKASLQDLRKRLSNFLKKLDSERYKVIVAMEEADSISHSPSLLTND